MEAVFLELQQGRFNEGALDAMKDVRCSDRVKTVSVWI